MDGDTARAGRTSPGGVTVKEEPVDDDRPLVMDTGHAPPQPPPPGLMPAFPSGPYPAFPHPDHNDRDGDTDDSSGVQDDAPRTTDQYLTRFAFESGATPLVNTPARAKREFVPEDKKDRSYWNKRQKNNISARKSRMKRKSLEKAMENKLNAVIQENVELRMELDALKVIIKKYGIPENASPDPANSESGSFPSAGSPALSSSSGVGTSLSGSLSGQSAEHSTSNSPALTSEDEPIRKPFQLKIRLQSSDDAREGGSPEKQPAARGLNGARRRDTSPGHFPGPEARCNADNINSYNGTQTVANRPGGAATSLSQDAHLHAMSFPSSASGSASSTSSSSSGYAPHPIMLNSFPSLPPAAHLPPSAVYWPGRYPTAAFVPNVGTPTDLSCHSRKSSNKDVTWGERSEGYGSWVQQDQGKHSRSEGYGSWIQQGSDQGHQSTEDRLSWIQQDLSQGQAQGQSAQNKMPEGDERVYGGGEVSKSGWPGEEKVRQRVPLKCRMKQEYTGNQVFS